MANGKNNKKCTNCETLNARIRELEARWQPKPYTLKVGENGEKSNAYVMAEIAGLVADGEEKTWTTRKEYNAQFALALSNPEVALKMVALYTRKGWDLNTLKEKVKEAKEAKEKAYKTYKQKAEVYKNLATTQKAVKKAGLNAEQFAELCNKFAPAK